MDPATRLRPAPDVLLRPEDDEAFLFVPATGRVLLLNATGLAAWRLLDGTRDAAAVTAALCASFPEAAPEAVAADVGGFFGQLVAAGLVEVVAGA